jgi:predicted O-methyltransferase YrrM
MALRGRPRVDRHAARRGGEDDGALVQTRHPIASRLRSAIDRLAADGFVIARADGSRHDLRSISITAREGEALTRWVLREKAVRTIEIGLGYGVSALHVCAGLIESGSDDARHVVIDPFQSARFSGCGLQVLEEAGVIGLVEHHDQISQIVLPRFLDEGRRFDFAFVDGNHRFDGVFLDLFHLGRLVRKGGAIFLDDYDLPGVRRAVSFFLTNLGWRVEESSSADEGHHWVVVRTAEGEDTRDFRYFVEF